MNLKFENPKFSISCKIAFDIFFLFIRSFWNKQHWVNKTVYLNFLRN